jgi:hypothetical protein
MIVNVICRLEINDAFHNTTRSSSDYIIILFVQHFRWRNFADHISVAYAIKGVSPKQEIVLSSVLTPVSKMVYKIKSLLNIDWADNWWMPTF